MDYQSSVWKESAEAAGVRYRIRCMSFGRRLELMQRVGDSLARLEFLQAGEPTAESAAEATLLGGAIDREFVEWGLEEVEGLAIDGEAATPAVLIERGPESLVQEALRAVRSAAGLSEQERKNSESLSTSPIAARPSGSATNAAA
jgi:hypothetical protein